MSHETEIENRRARLSEARRALLEQRMRGRGTAAAAIPRRPADAAAPLSSAQERLWLLDQLDPGSPSYSVHGAVRLCGTLDVAALRRSLGGILERHEALRTSFPTRGGEPVQEVLPATAQPLPLIDLAALPAARKTSERGRLAVENARWRFDLSRGPLLRTLLLRESGNEHVLLVVMHHIVSDGWSIGIFVRDLASFYTDGGRALPPLPIQYADFAEWQRRALRGESFDKAIDHWRRRLAGTPPLLEVPSDRPRQRTQSYHGARLPLLFPAEVSGRLRSLAQEVRGTPFQVFLAAWAVLLHRLSGQRDLLIGSPVAHRQLPEIRDLIGFFVHLLPLRSRLSGDPAFRRHLTEMRQVTLDAHAHQDVPYELLVKALRPEGSGPQASLCQSSFVLQEAPAARPSLPGLEMEDLPVDNRTAKFDLSLEVWDSGADFAAEIEYSTDLFDATTAARLARSFRHLLTRLVGEPDASVSRPTLLGASEAAQVIREWNDTVRPYEREVLLHEFLERQAESAPERVALVFAGRQLSYSELDAAANRLGQVLRARGVGPEVRVGVCVERSLDLVVALLGVLKAGGAYVPLDPGYPEGRLAFMLEDSGAAVLLTEASQARRLAGLGVPTVRLDAEREAIEASAAAAPDVRVETGHLAYVIYTSGSTGRPKGAMNSHRAIVNRLLWMQAAYGLTPEDRVLQKTPFSFDVSVWEFFWPLLAGARLVVARPEGHKDSSYLVEVICREEVTTLHFVPSMLQVFLDDPEVASCRSLRRVIASGEALPLALQKHFFSRLGEAEAVPCCELHNLYGPTEAAVDVTFHPCERSPARPLVPIGRPIANVGIHLFDRALRPVPIQLPGELHISGINLARGYLHRPGLTAEKFIPDPLGVRPGGRLYKTGDLARHLPDGAVDYLGRLDHQVKLRGFRIELGEIEAVLGSHPAVQEVVVLAREAAPPAAENAAPDLLLAAYCVPDEHRALPLRRLLALRRRDEVDDRHLHRLPDGLPVLHRNRYEVDFVYDEIFAQRSYLRHGIALSPGACVFDVGANVGLFSLFVHRQVDGARVYAFEPIPAVYDLLRRNAFLWGLEARLFDFGLAAATKSVEFTYYPHISILSGRFADAAEEKEVVRTLLESEATEDGERSEELLEELLEDRLESEQVTCRLRPISEVIREEGIERIDLLKIDVEKAELEVLAGIEEADWPKIRQIVVEVHDLDGRLRQVSDLLERHGLDVVVEEEEGMHGTGLYNLYARRGGDEGAAVAAVVDAQPIRNDPVRNDPVWSDPRELQEDLRKLAKGKLPEHMVPARVALLDELPLSPNGKVDRRALARMPLEELGVRCQESPYVAPRTPTEKALAELWSELLGVERIGVDDDFFVLGGHSLLATRMIATVRHRYQVEITVRALFDAPTVAALAARLEEARREGGAAVDVPVVPVRRQDEMPCSYFQERLWFLDQFDPSSATFNIPVGLRLRGRLDPAVFRASVEHIVGRHEVLRTTFHSREGRPVQVIAPRMEIPLPLVDLGALDAETRRAELGRLNEEQGKRPLDLSRGPLLRMYLIRLRADEHAALLSVHHIVSDGWSMRIFAQELRTSYEALAAGRRPELPELTVQYADFACWQRQWFESEAKAKQLAYWLDRFREAVPNLELPTDRPRPVVQTYHGARRSRRLPGELAASLAELSREADATLFMTLMAALKLLLCRLGGEEEIAVGIPIAGRTRAEVDSLIGYFPNTLALATDLTGDPAFRELLGRVRETAFEAYAHQELPFEHLIEVLRPERELSRTPLFQVFFNMLDESWSDLELPGLQVDFLSQPEMPSKFDLVFYVRQQRGGIDVDLVYNADLFDAARIDVLLDQYASLLTQIAADPKRPVGRYSLVTPRQRRALPDPTAEQDERWLGAVHEVFARQARRRAQHLAVVDARGEWTYARLDARSNQLAHALGARGIGRGDVVAIYCHRSATLVRALLGVLKSGAAFVMIDPAHPAARLSHILRLSKPRAFLHLEAAGALSRELRESLDELAEPPRVLALGDGDAEDGPLATFPESDPGVPTGPDDVAYYAFTSGTTGVPKGILGRHGSLSRFIPWVREQFGFTPEDRFSMLSALSHDPLHRDVFTPLQIGATIVVPEGDEMGNPGYLAEWLARERITTAHVTPAMAQLITTAAPSGLTLPALHHVFFMGEALTWRDLRRMWKIAPQARCVNLYGATETQRASGYYTVSRADDIAAGQGRRHEVLPVGSGMDDVQLLLLRGDRQMGIGEVGEICFRSPHMAAGYLDDPGLTRQRFVANPFTDRPGDRLYCTGDLGRYLLTGDVVYCGRADRQVKIRGFRIELGEIESILGQHPGVRTTVVEAWEVEAGDRRLAAYVVAFDPAAAPAADELRSYLGEQLPSYMVPSAFVFADSLPLKANGEVNRRALPEPEWSRRGVGDELVAPRTPLEERLLEIWQEVLDVERVGIHDNFFDLGGHSLLATQMVSRVRSGLGLAMPLRDLFEAPSVAELAERLGDVDSSGGGAAALTPIERLPRDGDLPLSAAQQRLWFLDQMEPGNPAYNIPTVIGIEGRLDVAALALALAGLVRRHETLRTTFETREGRAVQHVGPPAAVELPRVDLGALPEARREEVLRELARERIRRPFDLSRGPLLEALLLRRQRGRHVLVLVLHHIISDGWSLMVLFQDLAALYRAAAERRPSPLPEPEVQYADFAHWQNQWLEGEVLETQLAYWRERFGEDPPALELPTDRPRPAYATYKSGLCPVHLGTDIASSLQELAGAHQASLFMVLTAALKTVFLRLTGERDVVLGSPVAGRNREEIEGLIGMFFNLLALRTSLAGDPSFEELLGRVRDTALGAYAHQEMPFEHLLEELQVERHLNRAPLFQNTFVLQNAPLRPIELPELVLEPLDWNPGAAHFDLNLQLAETAGGLVGSLAYKAELFDASSMARLARYLGRILAGAVEDPGRRLSELPLLSGPESHQLACEWNDTLAAYPRQETLQALVEAQVARTPDAVAVLTDDVSWTYRELDRRADRLAAYLRSRGVGRGTLVGLYLSRSPEMVTAVLGVVKAGGAYVPVEPYLPAERVHFILDSLRITDLLTQSWHLPGLADLEPVASLGGVLCLDAETPVEGALPWVAEVASASVLDALPADGPPATATAADLAYIIFTSGSTGRPKGVMVRHQPVVNLLHWIRHRFAMGAADRVLFITSLSFDLSVYDVFGLLSVGGSIRVALSQEMEDPETLVSILERGRVTFWDSAPAALQQLVPFFPPADGAAGHGLRQVFLSGDWIPLTLPDQVRSAFPGTALTGLGGATEATVWSNFFPIGDIEPDWASIPYGRPMPNARYHVLDEKLAPAPARVEGDLYIGGECLSMGYMNDPGLSAGKYLPDPFSAVAGDRLYATGDRARAWRDGTLEFLGRRDSQVKIRGFRIELGEIESVLGELEEVREAAVLAQETQGGDKRLVAYVAPDLDCLSEQDSGYGQAAAVPGRDAAEQDGTLDEWQTVYDEIYSQDAAHADPTFNIVGWNSSYTGQPLAEEEMREWVERTVERILAFGPRRVLELGCGTGMLLYRIAPQCESYCATDLSEVSLEQIRKGLEREAPRLDHVRLLHRAADVWDGVEEGSFDTVILNSVTQHFPDAGYLLKVLEGATAALAPGGVLFVGDVRSFPLLEAFHASVQLSQAPETLLGNQLRQRIALHRMQEEELLVDPGFFRALCHRLPRVTEVEVRLKRGRHANEMTRFRYDVVLRVGGRAPEACEVPWIDADAGGIRTADALREHLIRERPALLGLRGLPNARLAAEGAALRILASSEHRRAEPNVAQLRSAIDAEAASFGVDPEELWALAETLPYEVDITWPATGDVDRMDVLLRRRDPVREPPPVAACLADRAVAAESLPALAAASWTNSPRQGVELRRLVPRLRESLRNKLPPYMMPSAFVVLDTLPVTANGKLDRRALPAPESGRSEAAEPAVAPRTRVEDVLSEVMGQVLGMEKIGVHDNFFELGGDSILSIQVVARVQELGLKISPRQLFQYQTVAELAAVTELAGPADAEEEEAAGPVPLTPIQRWFFRQEQPDPHHWNLAMMFETRQPLRLDLLSRAMEHVARHHGSLRLRFTCGQEGWEQRAVPYSDGDAPCMALDLAALAAGSRAAALQRAAAELQASLDLERGPLLRTALFDLGGGEAQRLLIVIHHLVIDGVAWRILLGDLQTLYRQLEKGEPPRLPPKTMSYGRWAEKCGELARSPELARETGFWLGQVNPGSDHVPVDHPRGANLEGSAELVSLELDAEATRFLLQEMPELHRVHIQEVLVAALALAFRRWLGRPTLRLELEGHGREELFDDVDVSRTTGWFTAIYPVEIDLSRSNGTGETLRTVKELLRQVPQRGVGYGLLRYAGGDVERTARLEALPQAQVIFNYLGQFGELVSEASLLRAASESAGPIRSARAYRHHVLEIYSWAHGEGLRVDFEFSRNLHRRASIEKLAGHFTAALEELVAFGRSARESTFTPSDFPEAELSEEELGHLLGQLS